MTRRAADYFKKARKPRSEWKKLDDLTAQLAEFDLRCVAGDYDTAGVVLTEIDFDYLLLWGHYRLMIDLCKQIVIFIKNKMLLIRILNVLETAYRETGDNRNSVNYIEQGLGIAKEIKNRQAESALLGDLGLAYVHLGHTDKAIEFHEKALMISREIADREGEGRDLSNLGNIYADLGDNSKAIEYYEQALVIAREVGNRQDEGSDLNNLGNAYGELGDDHKAIEYYEQALIIAREIGYRRNEGNHLINIGSKHANLGNFNQAIELYEQALTITREIGNKSSESGALCNIGFGLLDLDNYKDAIDFFEDAIQVADEISHSSVQQIARHGLTNAYLFQNDLVDARATIDAALRYDLPKNNHNATALHGIIALRQGDVSAAHQSFTRAIAQADEILAKTPDYYSALDAKGLALCGLAVCRGGSRSARTQSVGSARPEFDQDIDSFRAARKIAPHAGAKRSSPCCGCSMNWSSAMKIMY
ncbi:MAG: tetratricopeptide repeat protein [Chloroflexota bacterium]